MDIMGYIDGVYRTGKVVSSSWPDDSQMYIAVFDDGSRHMITVAQALDLHEMFVNTPGTIPIRIVIEDRGFQANEVPPETDKLWEISDSGSSPCLFVWYRDIEPRSSVSLSVAKDYPDGARVGLCFGKHKFEGSLVYLIAFEGDYIEGMILEELIDAALRFYRGGYVPIRVVL